MSIGFQGGCRLKKKATSLRRAAGFTLIEIMVALAIAAFGIAALLAATRTGLGGADLSAQYVEATRLAQSHLATVGILRPLAAGEESGSDDGGFSWRIRISPPLSHAVAAGSDALPALYAVETDIEWLSGGKLRQVTLQSQRAGPVFGAVAP